jgi:hypothetical protein
VNAKTQELIQEHKHVKAYRQRLRKTLGSFNNFKATKLDEMIVTVASAEYEDLHDALETMDIEAICYVIETLADIALVARSKANK